MPIAAIIDDILEEFPKQTNFVEKKNNKYSWCLLFTKKPLDYNLISHQVQNLKENYIDHPGMTGLCNSFISL